MKRRGITPGTGSDQRPTGGFFGGQRPGASDGSRSRREAARIWILTKTGEIKPVFIRTGVTDDSYIEVKRGRIEEGQLVITGILSGPDGQDRSNRNRMRGGTMCRLEILSS